jgi:hypothetical protein
LIRAQAIFACPRCGTIRAGDPGPPPWCRHGDIELPAARMKEKPLDYLEKLGLSLAEVVTWGVA